MFQLIFSILVLALGSTTSAASWSVPSNSFDSDSTFNSYWNYNYPWGTDHNGGARMDSSQVSVANGQLNLTATYVTNQPPTGGGTPINYLSGTVYAQQQLTVAPNGGYGISGQFLAPTAFGTWPAIWLTGADSWPPEVDLAEWKGTPNVWFNTVNTQGVWQSYIADDPDSGIYHSITALVLDLNGVDMDDVLQTTQTGTGMVGAPFWL